MIDTQIPAELLDDDERKRVLTAVLTNRCRKRLDYGPQRSSWRGCDSRGG